MVACRLCLASRSTHRAATHDTILATTRNFLVIPSLGALVPGYVLVVPKRHVLSLGSMASTEVEEARDLVTEVEAIVTESSAGAIVFEHGPSRSGAPLGCSVDHGHVHVAPATLTLHESKILAEYQWTKVTDLRATASAAAAGQPYVFLQDATGQSFMTYPEDSAQPRQLVRRALADHLGRKEQYDWREFPEHHNVALTVTQFIERRRRREGPRASRERSTGICA